jgi:tetraacyldisaccharide 4'-kinase
MAEVPIQPYSAMTNTSHLLTAVPAGAYFLIQRTREALYNSGLLKRSIARIPVISVGNIVMGGSGKSPFTIYLGELALSRGLRPAIISRGYRGAYRSDYLIVSEGLNQDALCDSGDCGDEPLMMAGRLPNVPVVVSRKRIVGTQIAATRLKADMAILDDGFQHMGLARDLDVAMITGKEDHMFPMGSLREPLSALRRADVIIGPEKAQVRAPALQTFLKTKPYFEVFTEPLGLLTKSRESGLVDLETLEGKDTVLVSGIANPERFENTASKMGWRIVGRKIFPDHYHWTEKELEALLNPSPGYHYVFTEKDWVKLPLAIRDRQDTLALRIRSYVKDQEGLWSLIEASMADKGQ